jgi:DTW domain-containing protein
MQGGQESATGVFPTSRAMCWRCRRPTRVCYCAALPRIPTATRVLILQHPRERDMPIGTARMASLCLPNSVLQVGIRWDDNPALQAAVADSHRQTILLYPGNGAIDIVARPPAGPVNLVIVDGTWSQAKTVVRDSPILQRLPRYAFVPPAPSVYRIRREPFPNYVSTIEALMYALGALEQNPDLPAMIRPLNAMVDAQLRCKGQDPSPRQKKVRPASVRLPQQCMAISRWRPETRRRIGAMGGTAARDRRNLFDVGVAFRAARAQHAFSYWTVCCGASWRRLAAGLAGGFWLLCSPD